MPSLCNQLLVKTLQSLLELVNSTAGVNELLLTGKEGMALRANFNSYLAALGGSGFCNFATSASDDAGFVIRMDSVFHVHVPLFKNLMFLDIGEPHRVRQTKVLYHTKYRIASLFQKKIKKTVKRKAERFQRVASAEIDVYHCAAPFLQNVFTNSVFHGIIDVLHKLNNQNYGILSFTG